MAVKKTLTTSKEYAESIVNTVREPLIVLDQGLRVVFASHSFYDVFKVKPEETVGQLIYDLGNKQWDIPKLRELLEDILPRKATFDDYEVEHDFTTIGRRSMLLNARQIERVLGKERIILLAIEDITERKKMDTGLEKTRKELAVIKIAADEDSEFAESVINTVREPLIILDQDLRVVTASRSFYEFFKVKPEETERQLIYNLGNKQWDIPKLRELLETILPDKTTFDNYEVEHDFATIGRRVMLLNARQIQRVSGKERIILLAIEDITEHKRLENILTDSEELYRGVFDNASDGILLFEKREGKIVHVNSAAEKMLGYSSKEIIGNKIQDIGFMFDMDDISNIMQKLNKNHVINYTNVPLTTKSMQHMDTDIYLVNKTKVVQCNIRDITDRKMAEDTLRQNEEKYRTILEDIQEGYFEVDFAGNFTFFNDSLCRFLGYSKEELMGMNNRQYTDEENAKKLFQAFNKVYNAGESTEGFDWQIIRKDGTKRYVEASVSLQKDSSGKPKGFRGIARDVTERKRVEAALQKSEADYRQLFDNAPSAIYQIDFRTGKFLKANDIICEYFGCSQEEITSLSPYDLLTKESQKLLLERLNKMAIGDKVPEDPEYELVNKNGMSRWLKLNSKNIYDSEGLAGADVVAHDITERKRAEEALKESEKKYRLLADNVEDVIFVLDMNLNYTYISPSVKFLRGYEQEELLNKLSTETLTPTSMDLVMKTISEIMELEKSGRREEIPMSRTLQLEMVRKDKTTVWTDVKFSLIRDENQQLMAIMGVTRDITERKKADEKLQRTLESLKRAIGTTIQVMISAVEMRDPYTSGHQARSADLARAIATEMGLAPEIIDGIRMAGTIDDIGKLSIPAELLSKPTKLTDIEFSLIKEHSQIGYEMLKDVESPWPLAQIVYQHHERMNGSGYPRNLKGDEIIIEALIMAVADVVEAMASHRPYRPTLGIEATLEEIEKNKGLLYDAAVADACLRLFREKDYKLPV